MSEEVSAALAFDKSRSDNDMRSDIDNCLYPKSKSSPHFLTYAGD